MSFPKQRLYDRLMAETLGEVVDRYLRERKITAYRLAKITGVSEATISGIRNNRHGASMDMIKSLAAGLKAPPEEFFRAAAGMEQAGRLTLEGIAEIQRAYGAQAQHEAAANLQPPPWARDLDRKIDELRETVARYLVHRDPPPDGEAPA